MGVSVSPRASRSLPRLFALLALVATPAWANPEFEWLDVRRKGADAIADLGRHRTATQPWQRAYRADVPAGHPLAGLRLVLARAFKDRLQLSWRVAAGPKELLGSGMVVDGAKAWLRVPGEKIKPIPQETLFRALPLLGVPWILFCALELPAHYSPAIEGEFEQVAVLRLTPRYELGVTARPAKASISKIYGHLVAMAINDGKGTPLGEIAYLAVDKLGAPGEFNLKGPGEQAQPLRFAADGPVTAPAKNAFSPGLLK